jgi:hypothetical protein
MKRYLLILSCSQRKRRDPGLLPAIERYDGVNFRVLRKLRREDAWPDNLEVLIVSAKYGLLKENDDIEYYEQKMTGERAIELQDSVGGKLGAIVRDKGYQEIFVNLGKGYLPVLGDCEALADMKVVYASGGIGHKMAQMRKWILKRGHIQ